MGAQGEPFAVLVALVALPLLERLVIRDHCYVFRDIR
jgi:hypothetical protein